MVFKKQKGRVEARPSAGLQGPETPMEQGRGERRKEKRQAAASRAVPEGFTFSAGLATGRRLLGARESQRKIVTGASGRLVRRAPGTALPLPACSPARGHRVPAPGAAPPGAGGSRCGAATASDRRKMAAELRRAGPGRVAARGGHGQGPALCPAPPLSSLQLSAFFAPRRAPP